MGGSREEKVDVIINVDPFAYYNYPYQAKPKIANLIGAINQHYKKSGKVILLITPGRIGTSSPELGVPVSFADISECNTICEVSYSKAGYMPELSYGSHMFQDLVEANILYAAIFENAHTLAFQPDYLKEHLDNKFAEMFPEETELADMIGLYEPENCMLYHDFEKEETLCYFGE